MRKILFISLILIGCVPTQNIRKPIQYKEVSVAQNKSNSEQLLSKHTDAVLSLSRGLSNTQIGINNKLEQLFREIKLYGNNFDIVIQDIEYYKNFGNQMEYVALLAGNSDRDLDYCYADLKQSILNPYSTLWKESCKKASDSIIIYGKSVDGLNNMWLEIKQWYYFNNRDK